MRNTINFSLLTSHYHERVCCVLVTSLKTFIADFRDVIKRMLQKVKKIDDECSLVSNRCNTGTELIKYCTTLG